MKSLILLLAVVSFLLPNHGSAQDADTQYGIIKTEVRELVDYID